jgi:hypothetical protein
MQNPAVGVSGGASSHESYTLGLDLEHGVYFYWLTGLNDIQCLAGIGWGTGEQASTWANGGYLHVLEEAEASSGMMGRQLAGGLFVGILVAPKE